MSVHVWHAQGKSWSGKYESDNLWGHKAGVKALKLLPSQGVLLTGMHFVLQN